MAEATGTTRPARTRSAAAKSTPAKATPAKKAPAPAPAAKAPTDEASTRLAVTFVHAGDTKSYAKYQVVEGNGCVGTLYVPLGATEVKAVVYGPAAS